MGPRKRNAVGRGILVVILSFPLSGPEYAFLKLSVLASLCLLNAVGDLVFWM